MTELNEEHFELHDQNKAERYERQKLKRVVDDLKDIRKVLESHAKILARFQMTENKDPLALSKAFELGDNKG